MICVVRGAERENVEGKRKWLKGVLIRSGLGINKWRKKLRKKG